MALILNSDDIQKLKEFAEANVLDREELLKISKGEAKCVGDRKGYSLFIPTKYRLVYSIEYIPSNNLKQTFKCKRMSISVLKRDGDQEQKWVNETSLKLISQLLGFSDLKAENVIVHANEHDTIPNICITEIMEEINH